MMKRTIAFVYVLGLFVLGILVGALGMRLLSDGDARPGRGGRPHSGMPPLSIERMQDQLELTPEQSRQVAAILDESREQIRALREELRPRMREQMEQLHTRVAALLTPEQREKFEQLRRRKRRGHPREPRPDEPPPP